MAARISSLLIWLATAVNAQASSSSMEKRCTAEVRTTGSAMIQMRKSQFRKKIPDDDQYPAMADSKFELCKSSVKLSQHNQRALGQNQISMRVWPHQCKGNEIVLWETLGNQRTASCCPEGALWCGGCARSNAQMTGCKKCLGGFVPSGHSCVACADTPHWLDRQGRTCQQLEISGCNHVKNRGLSPNEACCKCGGGHRQGTAFSYKVEPLILGSMTVRGQPLPRTSSKYALEEKCALIKYGLTLDGTTGHLSLAADCPFVGCWSNKEPFEVSCKLIAQQAGAINASAIIKVKGVHMGYRQSVIIATQSRPFELLHGPNYRSPFVMNCLPREVDTWLAVGDKTGALTVSGNQTLPATLSSSLFPRVAGGICRVAGLQEDSAGVLHNRSTTVVVAAPRIWPSLNYGVNRVFVTLGEISPSMMPVHPASDEVAPTKYSASCTHAGFVFDVVTGVATLNGSTVLTLNMSTGSFRVMPSKNLLTSLADDGAGRSGVSLTCTVYGHYDWESASSDLTIHTTLQIEIRENNCWTTVQASFAQEKLIHAGEVACRALCRDSATCTHFTWESGACKHLSARCTKDEKSCIATHPPVVAHEKIPSCGERTACIDLSVPGRGYLQGIYCPVGNDGSHPIYLKKGVSDLDDYYMAVYDGRRDLDMSCHAGNAVLKKPAPKLDFEDPRTHYIELQGDTVACVKSPAVLEKVFSTSDMTVPIFLKEGKEVGGTLQIASLGCGMPNTTFAKNGDPVPEGEEEELETMPLVLDDPSTELPDDHWLHPCQCFPMTWGPNPPVVQAIFDQVPAGSGNRYLPARIPLVNGEMVCEIDALIGILAEDDKTHCELGCTSNTMCNFYWHGKVSATSQCRLYSRCTDLVREPGAVGELVSVPDAGTPLCRIANPEVCWKASKRRSFLGARSVMNLPFPQCMHEDIVQQCDHKLLLGGVGVETCSRCEYIKADAPKEHAWSHKTMLHQKYEHGQQVRASCWNERFVPGSTGDSGLLTCVSGTWLNVDGSTGLSTFSCEACIQVVSNEYADLDVQGLQELFFVNNQELVIFGDASQRTYLNEHLLVHRTNLIQSDDTHSASSYQVFLYNKGMKAYLRMGGAGCHGNHYCVNAGRWEESDMEWTVTKSDASKNHLHDGDIVRFEQPSHKGYLELLGAGAADCPGNRFCISANRKKRDRGKWIIKKVTGGKGSEIKFGDEIYVENADSRHHPNAWLDISGNGNANGRPCFLDLCVSAARQKYASTRWTLVKKETWYDLGVGPGGSAVRCAGPDEIACASTNGNDCMWHQHPKLPKPLHTTYDEAGITVIGPLPRNESCEKTNWRGPHNVHPCTALNCWRQTPAPTPSPTPWPTPAPPSSLSPGSGSKNWFYLFHKTGGAVPVRCEGPDKIECASDDGVNCLWEKKGRFMPFAPVLDVNAKKPRSTSCFTTFLKSSDGTDPCRKLGCYDRWQWFFLDAGDGVPVRCGSTNKLQCASNNKVDCLWGVYPKLKNYEAYSHVSPPIPHYREEHCPSTWINHVRDRTDPCKELRCYDAQTQSRLDVSKFVARTLPTWEEDTKQIMFSNNNSKSTSFCLEVMKGKSTPSTAPCTRDGTNRQQMLTADEIPLLLTEVMMAAVQPRTRSSSSVQDEEYMSLNNAEYEVDCPNGVLSSFGFYPSSSYPLNKAARCSEAAFPSYTNAEIRKQTSYKAADKIFTRTGKVRTCLTAFSGQWLNTYPQVSEAECDDSEEQNFYFDGNNRIRTDSNSPHARGRCIGTDSNSLVLKKCEDASRFEFVNGQLQVDGRRCVQEVGAKVGSCSKVTTKWSVGRGVATLSRAALECPTGTVIKRVVKEKESLTFTCMPVVGLGECVPSRTDQVTIDDSGLSTLEQLMVPGFARHALQSISPQVSMGGKWVRLQYVYCRLIFPSALRPTGTIMLGGIRSLEGIYCPVRKDATNRPVFAQRLSFGDATPQARQLAFNVFENKWCMQSTCVSSQALHPLDEFRFESQGTEKWVVRPVSDFDGKFEAKGAGKGAAPAKRSSRKTKPPQLIKFALEKPTYAEECQDDVFYDKTKMKDAADDLKKTNPCKYIATSGTRWKNLHQDGSEEFNVFTWEEALGCLNRETQRDYDLDNFEKYASPVQHAIGVASDLIEHWVCEGLPGTVTAPLGMGGEWDLSDKCKAILVTTKLAANDIPWYWARYTFDHRAADAGYNDCGLGGSMARIFCDLHCVRDAVKQGDRAILESIKKSQEVLQDNSHQLLEYYTQTVLDKIDSMKPKKQALVHVSTIRDSMNAMLTDMQDVASKAIFDVPSRASILRSLEELAVSASSLPSAGNISEHLGALLDRTSTIRTMVHFTSSNSMRGAASISSRLTEVAGLMRKVERSRNNILGIFTKSASISKEHQKRLWQASQQQKPDNPGQLDTMGTQVILVDLDKTWWAIRAQMDKFLEALYTHAHAYRLLVDSLDAYTSKCSIGYLTLNQAYSKALHAEKGVRRVIQKVQHNVDSAVGLLVSQICDGDVINRFAQVDVAGVPENKVERDEVCSNTRVAQEAAQRYVKTRLAEGLFGQLLAQLQIMFQELEMLHHSHRHQWNAEPTQNAQTRLHACLARTTDSLNRYESTTLNAMKAQARC